MTVIMHHLDLDGELWNELAIFACLTWFNIFSGLFNLEGGKMER